MSKTLGVLLGLVCLLFGSSVLVFQSLKQSKNISYIHAGKMQLSEAIAYWQDSIRSSGPQSSHDMMVAQAGHIAPEYRHLLAHTFGEALYRTEGLSYISYCGAGEFIYGCYHQFIGMATAEYGASVIVTLRDACNKSSEYSGGCMHGIGHGLVSMYGYTFGGLQKSLGDCKKIFTDNDESGNCADGAFMEYNLQEITTLDENRIPRVFLEKDAYNPCFDIDPNFRDECIYEQPLWWFFSIATSSQSGVETFKEMGSLCRSMPAPQGAKNICFSGIGFPAAQVGTFSVSKIIEYCNAASTSSTERLVCLSGAARRFYENGLPYKAVCGDFMLADSDRKYCENYVSISRKEEFLLLTRTP